MTTPERIAVGLPILAVLGYLALQGAWMWGVVR